MLPDNVPYPLKQVFNHFQSYKKMYQQYTLHTILMCSCTNHQDQDLWIKWYSLLFISYYTETPAWTYHWNEIYFVFVYIRMVLRGMDIMYGIRVCTYVHVHVYWITVILMLIPFSCTPCLYPQWILGNINTI